MKKNLLFLFLFIFSTLSWGQQNAYTIGVPEHTSVLIQFENKEGLVNLKNMSLDWIVHIEVVFVPFHIYKIEVNTELKHIRKAEQELEILPFVKTIQPNRKIEHRTVVPNDSLYPIQWNMKKIQMEEAWGITTGGPTSLGDTVVIAIIDAGFDTSHPDFGNNLWINRNEIPGDTVDNDGNGYAGDYYGWNTYSDNGVILDAPEFAAHGMPVTGIIGAVGNNDSGIAGVGWNNRFLIIQGGGDEANALKSYGYVLVQKKIYIETNGAKGANIIATNSSWGKAGLFPNDAPLWCAFYDSLGKYGIINVTAVPNSLSIVDELNGDMPTLCPSDYTITVTSTNSLEKVNGAFGKFSVDLGAPGHSILTTASYIDGNRYKTVNGTSVATPHVSGVVGLLYSAGCDSFSNYAKLYPDSAALWIKYFIMNGVDSTEELADRTVSFGRLNAYKALLLMQDWCEGNLNTNPGNPNPPPTPPIVIPSNYTLFPNPGLNSFTIRGDISKITRIEIISLTGQIVHKVSLAQIQDPVEINIETTFGDGLYFVKTYNQKGEVIFIEKWLKIK